MAAMDRDAIRNYIDNATKENLSANERPENLE
jgi:hypothetical protein